MNAKFVFQLTALIMALGLVAAAHAQSTNPPPTNIGNTNATTTLPEITVIGHPVPDSLTSPSAEKAAGQNKEIPGGFTVKTADEMKKGRTSNFLDLLQGVPGLFMQSENGVEISKVSIRGSGIESDDEPLGVEFLLDGISFDQGDGETIIEDFDVSTLKYAEVYRGADAFKYGALTMGGAINLVPFTGYDADPYQIQMEGGSYGFMRGEASSAGVDGPFDYYVSASGRYRDGFREHSREDTELLFGNFGYKISDNLENRFYLTLDRTDRQLPGGLTQEQMAANPQQDDPNADIFDYKKEWYYLRLADKISYENNGHELDASIYWWHRELKEDGYYDPSDYEQGIQIYHADDGGISLNSVTHSELFGQQNILTIGLSPAFETEQDHNYENLGYLSNYGMTGLPGVEGNTIARDVELSVNIPLYAENQHYITEKLSLLTGAQVDYVVRHFYDQFNDTLDGDQSAKQDFIGFSPKIGLLYEINNDSQAFINFSRAFQPPSFDNMVTFDDNNDPGGSLIYTPLEPQRAWTLELGTRGKQGRFDWDLALYHSWVRDELQDLYDALGNDRGDVNVARSYHQGIEAGLGVELWNSKKVGDEDGQSLKLNQTYTLNDFHFDGDPVYGNNRLAAIPIHIYEADLMYESPCGFYAGPNVQCNLSSYPVDQQNTLYAGAYALLGFKVGYAGNWGKSKFSVFVEAKNLTDENYAAAVDPIPNGQNPADPQVFHPGDGRSFYGGVTWSW
jgi:iron complex outermembrane receptor protein